MHNDVIAEVSTENRKLTYENVALRSKNINQRRELRRLNTAMRLLREGQRIGFGEQAMQMSVKIGGTE